MLKGLEEPAMRAGRGMGGKKGNTRQRKQNLEGGDGLGWHYSTDLHVGNRMSPKRKRNRGHEVGCLRRL